MEKEEYKYQLILQETERIIKTATVIRSALVPHTSLFYDSTMLSKLFLLALSASSVLSIAINPGPDFFEATGLNQSDFEVVDLRSEADKVLTPQFFVAYEMSSQSFKGQTSESRKCLCLPGH